MPASPWIIDVNEETFEREVLDRSRQTPVVVDFWAPWCGPCRMLGPLLERLVDERQGAIVLAKVDTDACQQLAIEFGIESIPAVKAFRDGRIVLEFVGMLPEEHLRAFLDRIGPSEAEQLVQQAAKAALPVEAERLLRQALETDADCQPALVALARLLSGTAAPDEVSRLLDRVHAGGELAAEANRLRGLLAFRSGKAGPGAAELRQRLAAEPGNAELSFQLGEALAAEGNYAEALESLLEAARADRQLAQGKVKEAMVRIFAIIGPRSDLADSYRDQLVRVLY